MRPPPDTGSDGGGGIVGLAFLFIGFWFPLLIGIEVCKRIKRSKDPNTKQLLIPWVALWLFGWWHVFWWAERYFNRYM